MSVTSEDSEHLLEHLEEENAGNVSVDTLSSETKDDNDDVVILDDEEKEKDASLEIVSNGNSPSKDQRGIPTEESPKEQRQEAAIASPKGFPAIVNTIVPKGKTIGNVSKKSKTGESSAAKLTSDQHESLKKGLDGLNEAIAEVKGPNGESYLLIPKANWKQQADCINTLRESLKEKKSLSAKMDQLLEGDLLKTLTIKKLAASLEKLISTNDEKELDYRNASEATHLAYEAAQSAYDKSAVISENMRPLIEWAQRLVTSGKGQHEVPSFSVSPSRKRPQDDEDEHGLDNVPLEKPSNVNDNITSDSASSSGGPPPKRTKDSEDNKVSYCIVCNSNDHSTTKCHQFPTGKARQQIMLNRQQCIKCGTMGCDGDEDLCPKALHFCPFCQNRKPIENGRHMPQLCDRHWKSSDDQQSENRKDKKTDQDNNNSSFDKSKDQRPRNGSQFQRQNSSKTHGNQPQFRKQSSYTSNGGTSQQQAPQPLMSQQLMQPFQAMPTMHPMMHPQLQMFPIHPMMPTNSGSMMQMDPSFAQKKTANVARDRSVSLRRQRKVHPKSDRAQRDQMPTHAWLPED